MLKTILFTAALLMQATGFIAADVPDASISIASGHSISISTRSIRLIHRGPGPSAESLKSLDAYFAWRRTPEGEAWAK